jgi:hypothetical protein
MQDLSRPLPAELADFFFQPDDRYQLDGCVTALTRDGLNVAVLSSHAAALEHYGALLLTRLRKFTPTSKIETYFPASADDLLARFNEALANQSLAQAMQGRKNILATQFWVLHNAAALPEHELQLLASLVQNFPGANIRVILFLDTSRKQHQALDSFGKNILRWDIALPNAEQQTTLLAQAKALGHEKVVRTFLNRLNASDTQSPAQAKAKALARPFAAGGKSKNPMAKPSGNVVWRGIKGIATRSGVRWAAAIAGLLLASVGFVAWLYPSAFGLPSSQTPATTQAAETGTGKRAATSTQGKTADGKSLKANDAKPAVKSEDASGKVALDTVDELPTEAAAGQAWIKQLPDGVFVVQHTALPVFKNVRAWQQSYPALAKAHIVATYKPNEKLAQFRVISGPFKSRDEATEFIRQPDVPRYAVAVSASTLKERLSPSTVAAPRAKDGKENRR